jgi:hypothetical protein
MNTTIYKNRLGIESGGSTQCHRRPLHKSATVRLMNLQHACRSRFAGLPALLLIAGLLSTFTLHAQNGTQGSIVGTVTDSTGAAIVGATVTVTEMETATTFATATIEQGDYTVPYLLPGRYKVSVHASAFASQEVMNIILNVARVVRRDVSLSPGTRSESVTVSASTLSLDTDTAEIGAVITGRESNITIGGNKFSGCGERFYDPIMVLGGIAYPSGAQTDRITIQNSSIDSSCNTTKPESGYLVLVTGNWQQGYETPAYVTVEGNTFYERPYSSNWYIDPAVQPFTQSGNSDIPYNSCT